MTTNTRAQRIASLFEGLDRLHGIFEMGPPVAKGKKREKRAAKTVQEQVTLELWQRHLAGDAGIGIVPVMDMIEHEDFSRCKFAVIDVDKYEGIDFSAIEKQINDKKWPLVLLQSKSGGAHIAVFFKTAEPAAEAIQILTRVASHLGYAGSEIFPKQTVIRSTEAGNWINMPYFDCEKTDRPCIRDGQAILIDDFLDYAESKKTSIKAFKKLLPVDDEHFFDGPPCLQLLVESGKLPEGGRNKFLSNVCVYARLKYPDKWEEMMSLANDRLVSPPLSKAELGTLVASMGKKEYGYSCSDQLLAPRCDKTTCRKREYGIMNRENADTGTPITLDALVRIMSAESQDEVAYQATINGVNMHFPTGNLLRNWAKVTEKCMGLLGYVPSKKIKPRWDNMINEALKNCYIDILPPDMSSEALMLSALHDFIMYTGRTGDMRNVMHERAYIDTQKECAYFRWEGIERFLLSRGFKIDKNKWTSDIKKVGAKSVVHRIPEYGTKSVWEMKFVSESVAPPVVRREDEEVPF
jgi:Primase C terminal 1 (PriCT-1)